MRHFQILKTLMGANVADNAEIEIDFDRSVIIDDTAERLQDLQEVRDGIQAPCVNYKSGRTDQLDVAVRRAVGTAIGKTCGDLQLDLAHEMDCQLVEVSSHLGARPSHAEWQGRIYSLVKGHPKYPYFYDATGYGRGDGLCGWNCRHSFFPYFEGLSKPANAPYFSLSENEQVYKDTQKQRSYERAIRKSKRELAALDGARSAENDPVAKAKYDSEFAKKSAVLKRQEARLADHLKATGLLPDNSRVRVDGFGKSVSRKAVHSFKKQLLPNVNKAIIPNEKLTAYALNKNHPTGKHKAIAFENYLGYNIDNMETLINEVRKNLKLTPAKVRAETQYGQPYEVRMKINGVNGKTAWIKTGWIIDKDSDVPRLTSIYVDE